MIKFDCTGICLTQNFTSDSINKKYTANRFVFKINFLVHKNNIIILQIELSLVVFKEFNLKHFLSSAGPISYDVKKFAMK